MRESVAALLDVLSERRVRYLALRKRIRDSIDELGGADQIEAEGVAVFERLAQHLRLVYGESISPVYEKAMGHIFTIMLLTNDKSLLAPLMRIGDSLRDDRDNFERTISVVELAADGTVKASAALDLDKERAMESQGRIDSDIRSATSDLTFQAIKILSPLGPEFAELDYADILEQVEGEGQRSAAQS